MKHTLALVALTPKQIGQAKTANGRYKRITHALICGPYGQRFGTEKQCLKYWTAWNPEYRFQVSPTESRAIFPELFDKAVKTDGYEISDFESTVNLTTKLIEIQDGIIALDARLQGPYR